MINQSHQIYTYTNFQCVCYWLIRATWVCIFEYTIGRSYCHRFDYRKIRLNMADGNCLHFQIGRQSRGFFRVLYAHSAATHSESNKQRINGQKLSIWLFAFLFCKSNYIYIRYFGWHNQTKPSRAEQNRANQILFNKNHDRIESNH